MKVELLRPVSWNGLPKEAGDVIDASPSVAEVYIREGLARPAPVVVEVDNCEQVLECNL